MLIHMIGAIVGMDMGDMVIDLPYTDTEYKYASQIKAFYKVRSVKYVSETKDLIFDVDGVKTNDPSYENVGVAGAILFQKMTEMTEAMNELNV
jgi:Tfp pilus assembly protein PilV